MFHFKWNIEWNSIDSQQIRCRRKKRCFFLHNFKISVFFSDSCELNAYLINSTTNVCLLSQIERGSTSAYYSFRLIGWCQMSHISFQLQCKFIVHIYHLVCCCQLTCNLLKMTLFLCPCVLFCDCSFQYIKWCVDFRIQHLTASDIRLCQTHTLACLKFVFLVGLPVVFFFSLLFLNVWFACFFLLD